MKAGAPLTSNSQISEEGQPTDEGLSRVWGRFSIMSRSGGLKPRAVAGRPSVTRF